jgi:DNA mismatch repair protein MSH3
MQTGRGRSQPTISAFFQPSPLKSLSATRKRTQTTSSFPIDLTGDSDDDELPAIKRPRLFGREDTTPSAPAESSSGSVADDWRFSPEKSKQANVRKIRIISEKERHEAFKRKLLQDNNRFLRKGSSTVQMNQDFMEVDESVVSSEEDSFNKLSDMFSHKDKDKGKAGDKATVKSPKKHLELGPSGQSYTPLELQASVAKFRKSSNSLSDFLKVLRLKKDNVGTVLMVEVGYKYKFFGDDAKVNYFTLEFTTS